MLPSHNVNECKEWCERLQGISKGYNSMRYPDCWSAPEIPHTRYTRDDATKATELARKIVEYIDGLVG